MEPSHDQHPFVNPHARWSDYIPVWLKVFWKLNVSFSPPYQTIIPRTDSHAEWLLGVQPSEGFIQKLSRIKNKTVRVISKLTKPERLINGSSESFSINIESTWGDHGVVDESTGLNQTVEGIITHIKEIHSEFTTARKNDVFYCHCMAGKSRSFVETMALLHENPGLFDFDGWPNGISQELQNRLKDNPSFSDIAEYVKIVRPNVKSFTKLDGDQAGLVGLVSLRKWAGNPDSIKSRDKTRKFVDVQNIGLILEAPLDYGFRDSVDREQQIENLVSVYKAYQKYDINLLMAMVVPIGEMVAEGYNDIRNFEARFRQLKPSEQARFAILLKALEDRDPRLDLGELRDKSLVYAQQAVSRQSKLTAGDQVELLRAFGRGISEPGRSDYLHYAGVVKKILKGSGVDRYNQGLQLAELYCVAKGSGQEGLIVEIIKNNRLSYRELQNFFKRLVRLGKANDARAMLSIIKNNQPTGFFSFFRRSFTTEQIDSLIPEGSIGEVALEARRNVTKNDGLTQRDSLLSAETVSRPAESQNWLRNRNISSSNDNRVCVCEEDRYHGP